MNLLVWDWPILFASDKCILFIFMSCLMSKGFLHILYYYFLILSRSPYLFARFCQSNFRGCWNLRILIFLFNICYRLRFFLLLSLFDGKCTFNLTTNIFLYCSFLKSIGLTWWIFLKIFYLSSDRTFLLIMKRLSRFKFYNSHFFNQLFCYSYS